jgi:hypothetical protein
MKIQVIPFRARHIPLIKPDVSEEWQELALTAQEHGRGYTACLRGDPIGAAGVRVLNSTTGEAWALFSPRIKTLPFSLYRSVSKGLNEIIAEEKLKKVWALVNPDDEAALRFMQHLGFAMSRHLYELEVRCSETSSQQS